MNRRELDTLLAGVAAGRLDLSLSALDGPVAAYFGRYLPAGRLVLTGCVRADSAGVVTVTGTGSGPPFAAMTATLRFALTGDTVTAVVLTATAGPTWSLADASPLLAPTILGTLRFADPTLVLDSTTIDTSDPTATPMVFRGDLLVTPDMATVGLLFGSGRHPVTGEITMHTLATDLGVDHPDVPSVLLYGSEGATLDLGICTVTDLRYELVGDPRLNYVTFDNQVDGRLLITGTVPVRAHDAQGVAVTRPVAVQAQLAGWADAVRLTADFSALGPLTLADAAAVAGVRELRVPFGIDPGAAGVTLGRVVLSVTPGAATALDYVSMKLFTEVEWAVVPDVLVLQQIDLLVRVDRPFDHPMVSVTIGGLLGIGRDGTLELAADPVARAFGGGLRDDDPPLRIREVFSHFLGGDATHVPDLDVTRFHVAGALPADPGGPTFVGDLVVAGTWPITEHVELIELTFLVDHSPTATVFQAGAGIVIDEIAIAVLASYDSDPQRRWGFAGSTGPGQSIPVGRLLDSLAERFGHLALPAPLADLTVDDLGVEISTGAGRLFVTGRARMPVDGVEVDTTLTVDTGVPALSATLDVAVPGHDGTVRDLVFDARFSGTPTDDRFTAAWHHPADQPFPRVKELVSAFSATAGGYVPDGIAVDLHDVALVVDKAAGTTTAVLLVDLTATVDLAHLPVVGEHLTGATTIGLDPLRIVAASAMLPATAVAAAVLPDGVAALPAGDLAAGASIHAVLRLAGLTTPLAAPVGGPVATAPPVVTPTTTTAGGVTWHQVQRSFGPLTVSRIGLAHRKPAGGGESTLSVLVDAAISLAGLTLSLDGLAAGLSLADPTAVPVFDLAGMGLDYAAGPIEVGGAFLKGSLDYDGVSYPAYGGGVTVRTPQLSLTALGSYAQLPGGPSLFIAAFLDDPIGGPPFFFVRGLAAAFGYNRRLIVPPVDQIATFPLVTDAVGVRPPGRTLGQDLQLLGTALPASIGDRFLAVGVHFTSFGMIDSVVLVAATFGHRFELDVLGLSTMVLPAPDPAAATAMATPLAQVQLALRAALVPAEGSLIVVAQVTSASYVFSRDCHLRGGFAFASWFGGPQAGDFVLTAGGYHPRFPVPAHYPTVPRLGFDWRVSSELAVSGSGYFALTPGMLMAGGSLNAVWKDDSLQAWFNAAMDLLIGWQPYHYELDVHVAVGASYTFDLFGTHTISVHLGADLHLWGPEFGGTATLDLSVVSVTIGFGPDRVAQPPPVPWAQLRASVLPAREAMLAVVCSGADTRTAPDGAATDTDLGVIDPAGLVLRATSAVPAGSAVRGTTALKGTGAAFGVGPCGRAVGKVLSTYTYSLTRGDTAVDDRFDFEPVTASLPTAVWGGDLVADPHTPGLVEGLLTGHTLRPLPPAPPDGGTWLPAEALALATPLHTATGVAGLTAPVVIPVLDADTPTRQEKIMESLGRPQVGRTRAAVVAAVLSGAQIDLTGFDVGEYSEAPRVVAA